MVHLKGSPTLGHDHDDDDEDCNCDNCDCDCSVGSGCFIFGMVWAGFYGVLILGGAICAIAKVLSPESETLFMERVRDMSIEELQEELNRQENKRKKTKRTHNKIALLKNLMSIKESKETDVQEN